MLNNKIIFFQVLKEAIRGKSIGRAMSNLYWVSYPEISGKILDIGGGEGQGSYYRFLKLNHAEVKIADVVSRPKTDFVFDISNEPIPLKSESMDYVFMFNVLEHINGHRAALKEVCRVLKKRGRLIGTIPFLINIHPDPHDYVRFTSDCLTELFTDHGFKIIDLTPIGRGPFLAAYEQLDSVTPGLLHAVFLPVVWLLDVSVSMFRPEIDFSSKFPLAYNFIVEKDG